MKSVAVVRFETMGKRFTPGDNFYLVVDGVRSDYYNASDELQNHPSAIYSFVGSMCKIVDVPVNPVFFRCTKEPIKIKIVDSMYRPVKFRCTEYCIITLRTDSGEEMVRYHGDNESFVVNPIRVVDSAVIVAHEVETYPGLEFDSSRVEVTVLSVNTGPGVFEPMSTVVLEIVDVGNVCQMIAGEDGSVSTTNVNSCRVVDDLSYFVFKFKNADGQVIEVDDGRFEVVVNVKSVF